MTDSKAEHEKEYQKQAKILNELHKLNKQSKQQDAQKQTPKPKTGG